jgi:RHS repeat-associated protein
VIINKDLSKQAVCFFAANKQQITSTVYDAPYAGFVGIRPQPTTQRNLRNRVSYTSFANGSNPANYNQASFYTYDIEGNVDTLLQDYGSSDSTASQNVMNMNSSRWKKTVYQYDLISGKVNTVAYQPGLADQFYHRYTYDAENRLILAETSADSINWEQDAQYQYYKHGPLARTVIGDQQVQGIDYAYTLQGWLKGVNSSSLAIGYDMGRDGDTTYMNRYVARDAFGYNLTYYAGDYSPISSTVAAPFAGYTALITGYKSLWNGNISSMVVNIGKFNNPLLYMYTYDQLNRLTAMDVDSGLNQSTNSWSSGLTSISDYKERIAYDPNGNITQYLRNGTNTVNLSMDSLNYFYNKSGGKLINNQLNYIRDQIGSSNYPNDIDNQPVNNYAYDSIGNLIKDSAEGITNISWSVYGKILEIQRTATGSNPTTDIQYTYDAAGNRISKKVTNSSGATTYTWYSRDAQGNVMSTYTAAGSGTTLTSYSLALSEQHLYGSNRLGIASRTTDMKASYSPGSVINFQRGLKSYELTNHLGNVLVAISDKKNEVSSNGTTIDNFTADVRNANDYYPFGMQQPGRIYTATANYRYGFNGKENDNEVKGTGNQQDYGMRIYDPRVGKFLSTDPYAATFPWNSTYAYAENDVIRNIDFDGLEKVTVTTTSFAPYDHFASGPFGTYMGDGSERKFGDGGSFRVSGGVVLNLATYRLTNTFAGKVLSVYHRTLSPLQDYKAYSSSHISVISYDGNPKSKINAINFSVFGNNQASVYSNDIDDKVDIVFKKISDTKYLISGIVKGDRYPSNETIIFDEENNKLLLGASGPSIGGPVVNLPGDNNRKMSSFNVVVTLEKNSRNNFIFTSIKALNGPEFKPKDWNNKFRSLDPSDSKLGTSTDDKLFSGGGNETREPNKTSS